MCRLGKLEKAGKLFEHALALSPRHPDVLTEYGEFLERSDVTRANHLYTRALIFAPDHSRALQNRQRTQPLVEQNDLSQLERIDRKRDELAAIPESSAALRRIKKEAYFQQIHHTAGIEGNTMTLAETRTIVETRMAVGGRSVMEHNEILGLDAAIKYINTTLVNRVGAITLDDLLQIHRRVMGHADPTAAGELRTNQVYVSEHVPPPPGRIHTLLESFIEWLNAPETLSLHPVKYAALAHYKLVFIHPFSDGNGRTSRLLMNLIMMQAGYPPVIIRKQDRYIYYRTLQLANEGDLRPFVRFIAECAEKTLDVYVWATREYVQKIGDETERSPATAHHEQAEDDFVRNFNGDDLVRLRTPSAHREPQELPIDEIRLGASGPQLVEPLVQVIDDEPTQVTGELRLIRVDRRDAATLLPLIQRHIAPGTTVYSDEWAAYHGIDAISGGNYIHRTVNHQNNFINPADQAVHTQGIEGAWSRAKLDLMRLKRGTSPELLPGHLARLWSRP
ncbi:Adenosine monophosphate-protein transferase Fic [Amphibalanus amphitrite]|uniref:Protein adenylyltransferase Fic n=1 Tax=Amphibalanus amphitrite TaxID=1232801 RepID=A0A6A4WWB7_AMPAM|nr:Adenosine monophosphate-protein transferase Fic [Amphibalanus amphitrite]